MTITKIHLPFLFNLIFLVLLNFLLIQCAGNNSPETVWEKAEKFVKYHSSENYIKNKDGVFLSIDGELSASAWVDYFFSVYSTRNWLSETDEYAAYTNEPLLPSGITLTPLKKRNDVATPQLVIKSDDSNSLIIVEGYDHPDSEKVFMKEWKFPKLSYGKLN
ncbi:MAG: hypothetical protein WBH40_08005 [Ignavibacteriaceae bacterium]|jgi:hypothetical protein